MRFLIIKMFTIISCAATFACSEQRVEKEYVFTPPSEKDLKRTDFPQAIGFVCPDDTSSVYGYYCDNTTWICQDPECSKWQEKTCLTERTFFKTCIDKYEYPGKGSFPEKVTLDQAKNICMAKDGHLCSAKEWQQSCKGNVNSPYGTSDVSRSKDCNFSSVRKAGDNPACRNVHGVIDMIGNGKEWQAEGTTGYSTCFEAVAAIEDTNSFRCCYNPESK